MLYVFKVNIEYYYSVLQYSHHIETALTLRAALQFEIFEKIMAISLYWFAAQQQTILYLDANNLALLYLNLV